MAYCGKLEYAQERRIRVCNTRLYRLGALAAVDMGLLSPLQGHSPFSLVRARVRPLEFNLAGSSARRHRASPRCAAVCPAPTPAPYILRFDEHRPNPLYRRVCLHPSRGMQR